MPTQPLNPPTRPSQFEAILIDLWGTLLPGADDGERRRNLEEMAQVLDVNPSAFVSRWTDSIGERCLGSLGSLEQTIEHLAVALGARPSPNAVREALEIRMGFQRVLHNQAGPCLPALDALRAAGFRLAIVSDSSEETVRLWPESHLSPRFEVAVFSCVEGTCKPDPRMYRRALGTLGLAPSKCAYVGDGGSHELTGAEAVGLTAFKYRFPDVHQDDARFNEDTAWRGTRLVDLRELLRFAPHPPRDG